MDSLEFREEQNMSYDELVWHLLDKYGPAKHDYFTGQDCRIKSRNAKKTDKGLLCHHIYENIVRDLCDFVVAKANPFEYQKAENLVYCNYLEHLLLHCRIAYDQMPEILDITSSYRLYKAIPHTPGVSFIIGDCNALYNHIYLEKWQMRCYDQIRDNLDDYTNYVASLIQKGIDHYTGDRQKPRMDLQIGQRVDFGDGLGVIVKMTEKLNAHQWICVFLDNIQDTKVYFRYKIDDGGFKEAAEELVRQYSSDNYGCMTQAVYDGIKQNLKI